MDVSKPIELTRIEEVHILQNIRLILNHDLNPICSKENMRVQFNIDGEIKGGITCYLCLDEFELTQTEKINLLPLFVESMNILIGRQISLDEEFSNFKINMSPPKISMIAKSITTNARRMTQKYELQIEDSFYKILTEYNLEALN
jgi:hypothetical protein